MNLIEQLAALGLNTDAAQGLIRTELAGRAMQGILANQTVTAKATPETVAVNALAYADALLAKLNATE